MTEAILVMMAVVILLIHVYNLTVVLTALGLMAVVILLMIGDGPALMPIIDLADDFQEITA